ncbi:MAG: hypothetical protein IPP22_02975 [Nitrosomonas sp.]|nr:hypothetical protein [Nitrosomonas sp.]
MSDDAIWRILRKGIQLRRMRSWCVSTDPEFAAKAADVIGCTTTNALVLSIDEKPSIQALEKNWLRSYQQRKNRARNQKHVQTSRYRQFIAALNVATG